MGIVEGLETLSRWKGAVYESYAKYPSSDSEADSFLWSDKDPFRSDIRLTGWQTVNMRSNPELVKYWIREAGPALRRKHVGKL